MKRKLFAFVGGLVMANSVLAQTSAGGAHLFGHRPGGASPAQVLTVTAGIGTADIPGDTNLCLQAAVDYVGNLGGGIVRILPGRYTMHDSLHLRPRVERCQVHRKPNPSRFRCR